MRHVSLTCKNHPTLRWSCKEIAWSGFYNGCRNIHFCGTYKGKLYSDKSGSECDHFASPECSCPSSDLILSPEDKEIAEHYKR